MRVKDVQDLMKEDQFQGFPVIESAHDYQLVGYITRADCNYALTKIQSSRGLDPFALIFFTL